MLCGLTRLCCVACSKNIGDIAQCLPDAWVGSATLGNVFSHFVCGLDVHAPNTPPSEPVGARGMAER